MNFQEALAAIKKLDGGADLASAIEAETESLKSKNYQVIGEKRNATEKSQSLENALTAIAKALGIEGDLDTILKDTEGKVRTLATEAEQLRKDKTTLETRATDAEGKVKQAERSGKLASIAAKAGAEVTVLEQLLGDKVDEIAIADEAVKIGDKTLREYVEADTKLKAFVPALFPTQQTQNQPKQPQRQLPGGSPKGTDQKPTNPVSATVSKMKFAIPGSK
jgi:hypothetical protein